MVPGSTLRYGSNFIKLTLIPRASSRHPMDAAAKPLPSEDTTPPVTKMYFADISASDYLIVLIGRACGARTSIAGMRGGGNGWFSAGKAMEEFTARMLRRESGRLTRTFLFGLGTRARDVFQAIRTLEG